MKVKELIQKLQKMDPELWVTVSVPNYSVLTEEISDRQWESMWNLKDAYQYGQSEPQLVKSETSRDDVVSIVPCPFDRDFEEKTRLVDC